LPFPKPLARSSFLASDFDPTTFLSSLSNRFQTLEDLQNELRTLSQSLNKELLDLVNDNYQDFLSLGSTLSGGEEKVEEVRVGLLGFQRELSGIRSKVDSRRDDVANLLDEKRKLKHEIKLGRALLEIAERIEDLEGHLMIGEAARRRSHNGLPDGSTNDELAFDSFSEDSGDGSSASENQPHMRRLERLVEQYLVIKVLIHRHDVKHPFILALGERLHQIQITLRLEIEATMKQAQGTELERGDSIEERSSEGLLQLRQLLISEGAT
jgi:conserved oligomeric Golgi complex subunit 2